MAGRDGPRGPSLPWLARWAVPPSGGDPPGGHVAGRAGLGDLQPVAKIGRPHVSVRIARDGPRGPSLPWLARWAVPPSGGDPPGGHVAGRAGLGDLQPVA